VFFGKEELQAAGISERHIIIYSWQGPIFPKAWNFVGFSIIFPSTLTSPKEFFYSGF